MATIRERTIEWLIEKEACDQFTVNQLANDLGLERRQALNSLHGLVRGGLTDQLVRHGSGVWEWCPPQVIRRQDGIASYKYDDGLKPTRVFPMGFVGGFKVLARAGDVYLIQGIIKGEPSEVFAFLELIDGPIERLNEHEETLAV